MQEITHEELKLVTGGSFKLIRNLPQPTGGAGPGVSTSGTKTSGGGAPAGGASGGGAGGGGASGGSAPATGGGAYWA
ncbi:MAG: hypothetical protein RL748_2932 [Pseudomonadota bacterium]|jgi:hypothetical protein